MALQIAQAGALALGWSLVSPTPSFRRVRSWRGALRVRGILRTLELGSKGV